MTHRRACAGIALLSALMPAGPRAVHAQAAAAMKTYSNGKFGYSIAYPANWQVRTVDKVQLFAVPSDSNAFVTANAVAGTATTAEIRNAQTNVIKNRGTLQGTITYDARAIQKVTFQLAEGMVKTKTGSTVDYILLDTVHAGKLYDFSGSVIFGLSSTQLETKQLQDSLNSIHIK